MNDHPYVRDLLAGLAPAPLEPHERMDAAAARLEAVAQLWLQMPTPPRMTFAQLARQLRTYAVAHRQDGGCTGTCGSSGSARTCAPTVVADAVLGNEATR